MIVGTKTITEQTCSSRVPIGWRRVLTAKRFLLRSRKGWLKERWGSRREEYSRSIVRPNG